jgi:hypothetical protein
METPARFRVVSPLSPITDMGSTAKPVAAAAAAAARF